VVATLPVTPAGQPWTACSAPGTVLVVAADGMPAPCEFAPRQPGEAPATSKLQARLQQGQFPVQVCGACADRLAGDLPAPPVRDYGRLPAPTTTSTPRWLVLALGDDGVPAAATASLPELWPQLERIVLDAGDLPAAAIESALASLPDARPGQQLELRSRNGRAIVQLASTRNLDLVEFRVDGDIRALAAVKAAAARLGARLEARFVVTPEHWFWLEDAVAACTALDIPLEVATLDRGGVQPLAHVATDELRLVKDHLLGCWPRLGAARPKALRNGAFDDTCAELRHLLQRRLETALAGDRTGQSTAISLPRLDHPGLANPDRSTGWLLDLFGNGHLDRIAEWVRATVAADATAMRTTWFRVLAHRIAAERRDAALLDALRQVYAKATKRKALGTGDREFAATFDLTRFGGPWADRLGLAPNGPRRRPFAIGKPRSPRPGTRPDVTVLVPSFRHGAYIEATLRSVLAQRYTNFRLLVVDDRSPDDTVERARGIADPRLKVRVNDTNLGLGNSVLQALASVDTPYVALLNSDDLFHPDRLGRCREVLERNPAVQLVTTGLSLVDCNGGELTPENASLVLDGVQVFDWVHWYHRVAPAADLPTDRLFAALLECNFLATSSNLVCRTDWLRTQAGSLRSLKYCLDWQLFLQAALEGSLQHLHEPLAAYRLHSTNTVWFREGRRWSYFLEVNRVAATALRRYAERARDGAGPAIGLPLLDAVAAHAATNRETDGFALFLNSVLDTLALDRLAETTPEARELVERLNNSAEQLRRLRDSAATTDPTRTARTALRLQLGDLAAEQRGVDRNAKHWLQGYCATLESRLVEAQGSSSRLEAEKQALRQRQDELDRMIRGHVDDARRLEADLHAATQREQAQRQRAEHGEQRSASLQRDLDGVRSDLASARGAAAALADLRQLLDQELGTVRRERDSVRGERDSLRGERDTVRAERDSLRGERDTVRGERDSMRAERDSLRGERDTARGERDTVRAERDSARQERDTTRDERNAARATNQDLENRLRGEQATVGRLDARRTELESQLTRAQAEAKAEAERTAAERQRLQQQVESETKAKDAVRTELQQTTRQRNDLQQALANEADRVRDLQRMQTELENRRNELVANLARSREEVARLMASREWRWGNFLWNKMPLAYVSRRGKKWYRRLVDAKNRVVMMFRRRHSAEGTAVVTACWQWPIYSHTFVYQEMIGLTHLGLDVRMFHWDLGDTSQLHKAFGYLADNRTQLQPIWENHLRDKEHFEKTRPGRLRAFLERIAKATGRKVEELEKEPIVLQGCTFARMAELAGANYLHSYFFYDQTFMAMQAAWLLDLPRGVSCYADHMLDDYAFKLVPLHVELCSVIVATSARIKRELSQMTGGRFYDKIIVKPNGVDGARFPPVVRTDRKPGDPFEVVSISRIEPKKGLTHLVEAVAQLKKQGRKVKAHIVGSKDPHSKGSLEYAAEFEQRIKDLGVQDEVILHGMKRQEELPPILQRCRAFVAPYVEMGSGDKDGIPTAMLEGLASGLPVLTTDSGSILEVVTTEIEGIVVPQRDSNAFAKALQRLIDDPALERRMAKAARARFDREFDIRVTEVRLHERVAKLVAAKKRALKTQTTPPAR
jgi:glycosyltransferase involved in cell wall biosynthesis